MDCEANVDSYTTPLDAELAKAYLESHNIVVRLEGDTLMGAAFALGPMLGGVQLFVADRDADRASELLANYHRMLLVPRKSGKESPDELARHAWLAALVGFVTIPGAIHAYSVWLLTRVERRKLSSKGRTRYLTAWVLDLFAFALLGWLVYRAGT